MRVTMGMAKNRDTQTYGGSFRIVSSAILMECAVQKAMKPELFYYGLSIMPTA
jgi:hypothetical protein